MGRKILYYVVASFIIILAAKYIMHPLSWTHQLYQYVNGFLGGIFKGGYWGQVVRNTIALIVVPLLIMAIPALFSWGFSRQKQPLLYIALWCVWIVVATMVLLK